MKTLGAAAALVSLLALAACEGATSPAATDTASLNLDVATVAADATVDDVMEMTLGPAGTGIGVGIGFGPGGLPRSDLAHSRTVTFLDADGNPMEAYDPLTTAAVHVVAEITGSRENDLWSATVERTRDHVVSGLLGEETERTWNGTGTDAVSRTRFVDGEDDREYSMSGSVVVEDVVVGLPRSEHPWPLSGTITRHVVVTVLNTPGGDRTEERTAVVTFDGTRYATLTVNGEEYEIDLAERHGGRPRHRHGERDGA